LSRFSLKDENDTRMWASKEFITSIRKGHQRIPSVFQIGNITSHMTVKEETTGRGTAHETQRCESKIKKLGACVSINGGQMATDVEWRRRTSIGPKQVNV